jgi:hypothetical protein
VVPCEKDAEREKLRTEVTEAHREGNLGWISKGGLREHGGSVRETRKAGIASHRGHGGHRGGDLRWMSKRSLVNMVGSVRERREVGNSIA